MVEKRTKENSKYNVPTFLMMYSKLWSFTIPDRCMVVKNPLEAIASTVSFPNTCSTNQE